MRSLSTIYDFFNNKWQLKDEVEITMFLKDSDKNFLYFLNAVTDAFLIVWILTLMSLKQHYLIQDFVIFIYYINNWEVASLMAFRSVPLHLAWNLIAMIFVHLRFLCASWRISFNIWLPFLGWNNPLGISTGQVLWGNFRKLIPNDSHHYWPINVNNPQQALRNDSFSIEFSRWDESE